MTYSSSCGNGSCGYSSASNKPNLEGAVNKFYITINNDNRQVNNGIQHSIAAEKTGDIHIYNQTIDNRIGTQQNNYTINMDNRKVEFISPYITEEKSVRYLPKREGYALTFDQIPTLVNQPSQNYQSMITTGLLKPNRPLTQFIDDADKVKHLVIETFSNLTNREFPDDIIIHVLDEKEMAKAHKANGGENWNTNILGFAINRKYSPSIIFIKNNHLDTLMLTIGHELGHVLTEQLTNALDEESKAFAFEIAWAKTIIQHNIGNLGNNFSVDFKPANNGLHDKAFNFVQKLTKAGKSAIDVFWDIAKRKIFNPLPQL